MDDYSDEDDDDGSAPPDPEPYVFDPSHVADAAAMLDSYSEIGFYSDAAKARAKVAEFRALADAPPTVAELLPMVDATHEAWWQSASAPDVTLRARLDTVRGIVFEARLDDRSAWVAICALPSDLTQPARLVEVSP